MIRFRKRTEYALMMMSQIAKAEGKLVSVHSLTAMDMPRSYLVRIAKDLIKVGLIKAKEGRSGGYLLTRDANEITLKDVAEAVEVPGCPDEKLLSPYMEEMAKILGKHKLTEL